MKFRLNFEMLGHPTAIISDMDGLLIDSESWTFDAWIKACAAMNYDLPKEVAYAGVGKGREPFKRSLVEFFGPKFDIVEAVKFRTEIGNKMLEEDGLELRPGAKEFLEAARASGLPVGLASSTFREDALQRLKYGGIDPKLFDAVTFGDEVSKLKPDPEIYLTTAKKLGINSKSVTAFEDSLAGTQAALAAGYRVVCIPDMEVFTPPNDPRVILKESLFEVLETV